MLVFKARRRVSPALRAENTPSETRVIRNLVEARREVELWIERNMTSLMDAIAHRPWTTVADMIPDEPWYEFQAYLQEELLAEAIDAGFRAVDGPVGKAETPLLGYRFDATRPEASSWAAREAGSMVTEITTGQRTLIRDLVSRGQVEGITVDDTARTIRQSVGLTTQQAGWVSNHYDRTLAQNISAGLSPSQAASRASAATSRYQDRIHRYRAETIARTEIARAASEGRQIAWNQGIEQGFISPNAQKEWIAEADACEICSPRNGVRHPVNKPWPNGEPPAHPNCRCDLLLIPVPVERPLVDVAALADSLSRSALESLIFSPVDLASDFALRRIITTTEGDGNDRLRRLADRANQYGREGRPERRSIYEARIHQERTGLRPYSRTERDSFTIRLDDVDVEVKSKYRYTPTDEVRDIFQRGGISTPDMYELDPREAKLFHRLIADAKRDNKFGASVQLYDVDDYRDMRLFITSDGGAGFAIKDGDELVSVFRGNPNLSGVADHMVHLSVQQGARRADAFDTVLPHIYGDHGFVVVARTPWNDEFSPPGWDKRIFSKFNNGEPDVVFMAYNPDDYYGYFPGIGMTFGKDQYDDAYEYTKRVLGWIGARRKANSKPKPDADTDPIDTSYRGQHQAPGPDFGASMDDMTGIYPDDFYDGNALRYYGTGDDVADRQSLQAIMHARNDPNAMITVYRAVPRGVDAINDGDWVTPSLAYARQHGDSALGGDYVILDITVPARHLWTNADSLNEWGLYRGDLPDVPTPPVLRPQDLPRWSGNLEPPGGFLSFDDIIAQAERLTANAGDWRKSSVGDPLLSQLYKVRGFDALPTVVDGADFDALLDGGAVALYRGFGSTADTPSYMNAFRYGDYFAGRGIHGNGTYTANWLGASTLYADSDVNNIVRMTLSPNARVIDHDVLEKEWIAFTRSAAFDDLSPAAQDMMEDIGRYAVAMGYDAIRVVNSGRAGGRRSPGYNDYFVILNRGMVTVDRLSGLGPGAVWAADVRTMMVRNLVNPQPTTNELLEYARTLGYKVVVFDNGIRRIL